MYIVFLRFSQHRERAGALMAGHKAWLQRGFDDGVFLLSGSLKPTPGGGILAHGVDRQALEQRVREDPFVVEDVVQAEIVEVAPSRADARLSFLLETAA